MRAPAELSLRDARRIALTAQRFGASRPARVGSTQLLRLVGRLHAVQIDPINVLTRAHYLPAFSRLGAYPMASLDQLVDGTRLFESMVHDASIVPVRFWPLLRWRMEANRADPHTGARFSTAVLDDLVEQVAQRGPVTVSDLTEGPRVRGEGPGPFRTTAWRVNPTGSALRRLWMAGRVAIAGRRGIERLFDLPERVLPAPVLAAPAVDVDDARRVLLLLAGRAIGVGTAKDLADYFRLGTGAAGGAEQRGQVGRPIAELLDELVDAGDLRTIRVEGWRQPAFLDPNAKAPGAVELRCLLSPFDSLLWGRDRMHRLFGFRYRNEIYTPEAKREFGYYVLPFLLGDALVARVDLKADRANRALLVQGSFGEDGVHAPTVAAALAAELAHMARWLDLKQVIVRERGNLAAPLANAILRP